MTRTAPKKYRARRDRHLNDNPNSHRYITKGEVYEVNEHGTFLDDDKIPLSLEAFDPNTFEAIASGPGGVGQGSPSPYATAAQEVAALVEVKNKAYGQSFSTAPKILALLYPNGVAVEQYGPMLTIVRVLDKLSRIATDRDAFGESPWKDINGYSLLEIVKAELAKETP